MNPNHFPTPFDDGSHLAQFVGTCLIDLLIPPLHILSLTKHQILSTPHTPWSSLTKHHVKRLESAPRLFSHIIWRKLHVRDRSGSDGTISKAKPLMSRQTYLQASTGTLASSRSIQFNATRPSCHRCRRPKTFRAHASAPCVSPSCT